MPEYLVTATITLDSIDITDRIEADTPEEAQAMLEGTITNGDFNDQINNAAIDRGFEIVGVEVDPA